jgi:hypothetical protein
VGRLRLSGSGKVKNVEVTANEVENTSITDTKITADKIKDLMTACKDKLIDKSLLPSLENDLNVNDAFCDFVFGDTKFIKAWEDALNGGLNALKRDVNYLETLTPYSVGTLSRKFPSIGINEEGLIRHYTGPAHGPLNQALESGGTLTDNLLEFKITLNSGLNKLPNHTQDKFIGV